MVSVKKDLECPVCMETFVVPRSLSCMHTYCEECLRGLLKDEGDQMSKLQMCDTSKYFCRFEFYNILLIKLFPDSINNILTKND